MGRNLARPLIYFGTLIAASARVSAAANARSAGARRAQATEAGQYDSIIANLCTSGDVRTITQFSQTAAGQVRVQYNNADQVWLTNEHGDVVAFSANGGNQRTLAIGDRWCTNGNGGTSYCGDESYSLVAHAHIDNGCVHAESAVLVTWNGAVEDYLSSDSSQNFGNTPCNNVDVPCPDGQETAWTANEIASATPAFTSTNYGARNVRATVSVPPGRAIPFVYIRTAQGNVLQYLDGNNGGGYNGGTTVTIDATIPDDAHIVNVCAPLGEYEIRYLKTEPAGYETRRAGGEVTCASATLTSDTVSWMTSNYAASGQVTLPTAWTDASTLTIQPPSDTQCGTPPTDYVMYTSGVDSSTYSIGRSEPLTLRPSVAACDYVSGSGGACSLEVSVVCSNQRRTYTLSLTASYASRATFTAAFTAPDPVVIGCEEQHPGHGTTWRDSRGRLCECFNGVEECGAADDNHAYLRPVEAGFIAASSVILFCVLVVFGLRLYWARKEARQLPIEGQRRSVLFASKTDYVTSSRGSRRASGGGEIELPMPESAGGQAYPAAEGTRRPEPPAGTPPSASGGCTTTAV